MMTYTDKEYKIYLKVKRALLLEDARNATADYLFWYSDDQRLNDFDFEEMANQFEQSIEYFDPAAEKWEQIVSNYLEDHDIDREELYGGVA